MRRVLPALTLAALVVAGCSSGGADRTGSSSPSASQPSPTATPTPTPTPTPSPTTPKPTAKPTPSTKTSTSKPSPKPVAGTSSRYTYAFPVRCSSKISYGHSHHDYPATDIFAAVGCTVVSPVDGVVDEVSTVDTWDPKTNLGSTRGGLSFSVIGVDGVRYYGSHLSVLDSWVRPGVHVRAGQAIGQVGKSGDARYVTSHLHFGISWPTAHGVWWVRRGELYPWPYLDAWRAGVMRSPASAVAALHRKVGDHGCTVDC